MNIGEFNRKHKLSGYMIKYDGDINRYTLEKPSEEYRTNIIYFEWGVNYIRTVDGGNFLSHEVFDDFISVYQTTREVNDVVALELFAVNSEGKYRYHHEDILTQVFTEFGFNGDDLEFEEEVNNSICYVRVYLSRISVYNEDKLRTHLESQFDHEKNKQHIIEWNLYDNENIYRPFVTFEYKCEW